MANEFVDYSMHTSEPETNLDEIVSPSCRRALFGFAPKVRESGLTECGHAIDVEPLLANAEIAQSMPSTSTPVGFYRVTSVARFMNSLASLNLSFPASRNETIGIHSKASARLGSVFRGGHHRLP